MLPIPLFVALWVGINGGFGEGVAALFQWGFWVVIVSLLTASFIGTPVCLLLYHMGIDRWSVIVLAGGLIGAGVGIWLFPHSDQLYLGATFGAGGIWRSSL